MQHLADTSGFTPAATFFGIVATVIGGLLVWSVTRLFVRISGIEENLTTATRALDVTVSHVAPMQDKQREHEKAITDLKSATAVLSTTLERHETWAAKERDEIRNELRQPRPRLD